MVRWLISSGLLGLCLACGGSLEASQDQDAGGANPWSGGSGPSGGAASGGQPSGGLTGSGGTPFVEEPCPDLPAPDPLVFCDPLGLDPSLACPAEYGCYATLNYPTERCAHSQFVSECRYLDATSVGEQGEPCAGPSDCKPGFMCVVGAAAGARCGTLCPLDAADHCPDGLICGETDVPGYGVCY